VEVDEQRRESVDHRCRDDKPLGVAARCLQHSQEKAVNIMMISTSEIKVSCVVEAKYTELAVAVLHDAFGLEKEK